jgi:dynein heavy chain
MISGPPTYYDLIARDKEVVKSVLLLTGSVEGVKQQVAEYLSHFDKYAFLWKQSLQVRTWFGAQ